MKYFVSLLLSIYFVFCDASVEKMELYRIVPDVIDVAPQKSIEISYPSGVKVNFGDELTPTQVKDEPLLKFEADPNAYYLLVMTDPDAPNGKDGKFEVKHWLVGNIPGNDIKKGEVFAEYRGSGAPKGTGLHRYIFLVFKQNGKISYEEKKIPSNVRGGRPGFNIRKFAKKYDLGNPVAGNFFRAQYDSYVDVLGKNTVG